MVKYHEEFKQKVVDAYLVGEGGYASLAIRFGIQSKTKENGSVRSNNLENRGWLIKKQLRIILFNLK
ncbi:transposase [Fredinandcohnia sp. QZ13]|uniref:transposase n=1 Tax=Fredinandcohnia sp. QZ13 TaxID=3073144 RepID=UPI00285322F4|nr:transposase [Fredinandcohnia sp. QZ13]MDR4890050.1 transposase [Fredinandcohnia sp. QZ13]